VVYLEYPVGRRTPPILRRREEAIEDFFSSILTVSSPHIRLK